MVYRECDWKAMYEHTAERLSVVAAENASLQQRLEKPYPRPAAQIVGAGLGTAAVTAGVGALALGVRLATAIGIELLLITAVIIITTLTHLELR